MKLTIIIDFISLIPSLTTLYLYIYTCRYLFKNYEKRKLKKYVYIIKNFEINSSDCWQNK